VASDPVTLPEELRDLLERVDSFEKIEVMALAVRHEGTPLTIDGLAESLRLSSELVDSAAGELVGAGLLRNGADGTVTYTAAGQGRDAAVRALVRLYADDRLLVVRAMTQVAMDRLRSSAARVFADAFVVRKPSKKEPGDG
jgi:hypothetical protein